MKSLEKPHLNGGQDPPQDGSDHQALVERVLASRHFSRSSRLSAFLRYVCERALNGAVDEISEQQIGVRVFGRPLTYNPGEDNIVRSHARLLRQRLDAYFAAEGVDEPVRITIAKGAYIPVFVPRPVEPAVVPRLETAESRPRRRWMLAAGPALIAGGYGISRLALRTSPSRVLWQSIFHRARRTLIIPADAGLVLAQDLTRQKVALADYISGQYVSKLNPPEGMSKDMLVRIARRRYTGIADVGLASRLAQRPEASAKNTAIRYARDLRLPELKGSNAIFLGAPHSNPWLELFDKKLSFWLDLDLEKTEFVVQNRSPLSGEQAGYQTKLSDPRHPVWAVLSCLPNVDGSGHVLIVAGASVAGTESAAEFLLNDERMDEFLAKAPGGGQEPPYFNMLLEANAMDGSAQQARPIAWRFV